MLKGVIPWKRDFVGREDWRNWMVNSIKNAKSKSIILHIHGVGGIGKTLLLRYWDRTIDDSVLIDCILQPDIDSQVGHFVRSCKSNGFTFPRFELLWSIRKRVFDGVEPAANEERKWLVDAIGLIPVVGDIVDKGSKLIDAGRKLKDHLMKRYGDLHDWFRKELGEKWAEELIQILWKNPNKATILLMNAVQSDLNERKQIDSKTLVILIDNVDTSVVKTRRWNIDGHLSNDASLWQKMLSGVKSCVCVTAGRDTFEDNWCKVVGLEQQELEELDFDGRNKLFESRALVDEDLRESVDRICKGHPFLMQLVIDAIYASKMDRTDLNEIKSESLDEVRSELWRVFFSRIGQLTDILNRAALLPFIDRDILSTVCPNMKTKEWMEFQRLSFVRPRGDGYWSLHDIARELVVAEYGSRCSEIIGEIKELLIKNYRESTDALYFGLSVSLHEFISEESAIEALDMMMTIFRLGNKDNEVLRALEGVRFRSNRLVGYLEITIGNALMDVDKVSEAESHMRNALAIQRNLSDVNFELKQSDIAKTLNSLGILFREIGQTLNAENAFLESLKIRRELTKSEDLDSLSNVAMASGNLGNLYSVMERLEESMNALTEAKDIYTKLIKRGYEICYPDLASVLNNIGILQIQLGRFEDAELSHLETLEIRQHLSSKHPFYKGGLASTLMNLGSLKARFGQYQKSNLYLFKALNELENLKESSSAPSMYNPDIAMTLTNLGHSLTKTGSIDEAKEKLVEAVDIYRQLADIAPDKYNPFLAGVLINLSNLHLRLGENKIADKLSIELVDISRNLAQSNPSLYESSLANGLIARGNILLAQDEASKAREIYQEAISILRRFSSSGNHRMKFNLSCAINGIAMIAMKSSNYSEAEQTLKEVLLIRRELIHAYPIAYSFDIGKTLVNIGVLYRKTNRIDLAESTYQECIDVCTSAVNTPEITEIAYHAASCLYVLYFEDMGLSEEDAETRIKKIIEEARNKSKSNSPNNG